MAFTTGRSLLPAASAARSVDGRKEKQRGSRQRRQVSGLYPRQTTSVKRNKPRERGNSAGTAAAGDSDSGSRRTVLLSVGGWPLLSVAANAQEELKLLRQEVEYYARSHPFAAPGRKCCPSLVCCCVLPPYAWASCVAETSLRLLSKPGNPSTDAIAGRHRRSCAESLGRLTTHQRLQCTQPSQWIQSLHPCC